MFLNSQELNYDCNAYISYILLLVASELFSVRATNVNRHKNFRREKTKARKHFVSKWGF